jgi:peroxiredoxin
VDPLAGYRGTILVLLMGMPECPGTAKASVFLSEYAREKPEGVAFLRFDVAPPGGSVAEPKGGDSGLVHKVDRDRKVADWLEFFFYPTLYIIDKDGEVRFRGGCEPVRVWEMVAEIAAERPGAPKRVYTPPMPEVGSAAAAFAGKDLDSKDVNLDALRGKAATLLFFGSTTCPYSKDAAGSLPALVAEFKGKGAGVAVVNIGEPPEAIRGFYAKKAPRITVLADETGDIGEKKYGVRSVPFFYVLDEAGKIAARRPFTPDSARMALGKTLGLKLRPRAPGLWGAG